MEMDRCVAYRRWIDGTIVKRCHTKSHMLTALSVACKSTRLDDKRKTCRSLSTTPFRQTFGQHKPWAEPYNSNLRANRLPHLSS